MFKRIKLISILSSFLIISILSLYESMGIAQEEMGSGSSELFSGESTSQDLQFFQDQGVVTQSDLPASSISGDQSAYFQGLSDKDKAAYIRGLSNGDQIKYFSELSDDGQLKFLNTLSDEQRLVFFKRLDLNLKIKTFNNLDKSDRSKIFEGLNDYEQAELIEGLTRMQESSEIENILSGQFPKEIENELEQYGYSFFVNKSYSFKPLSNVPVGADYLIGPGDGFTIYLWGGAEESYKVTVSRDGNIIIPRIGTVNVSGLTFGDLKTFLGRKFKDYFTEFQINITMDTLRSIEIFLVGEVKNPGTYSVSSLSTIVTALYATGGPTKNGSLRNIKLIRNGETITTLDLYNFFINGIKDNSRLEPGDTIFIPVIEPVVGISGYVKRPAIYEMKGVQTIADIINLAGGVLPVSYLQSVIVERITDHQKRIVKSFNIDPNNDQTNENLMTVVQDGDLIKIYPVNDIMHHVVYLEGHVKYPREYEFKEGMKIREIIPSYNYLLNEPYLSVGEIIRLMPPDLHPETIKFNLGALMSGDETQNLELQDQDRIIIYSKWDKKDRPQVVIDGEVRNPGSYNLINEMRIKDLIFSAGNLTDRAYLDEAELTRFVKGKDGIESLILKFSVEKALDDDLEDNILLESDDIIYIREIPSYRKALARKIYLEGEFVFPGEYSFSEGERLSSVIKRAGGLTETAYPLGAIFMRESVKIIQSQEYRKYMEEVEKDITSLKALLTDSELDSEDRATIQNSLSENEALLKKLQESEPTGRMVINLDKVLSLPSSEFDFELQAGDHLVINKKVNFINITGEVYNPTALVVKKGKGVSYYLNQVGGPTKWADKRQMYVVKADGTVISKKQGGLFGLGVWNEGNSRWSFGSFGSVELSPGDTIIVPRKITYTKWLKNLRDISQIVYQIAVAANVIHTW